MPILLFARWLSHYRPTWVNAPLPTSAAILGTHPPHWLRNCEKSGNMRYYTRNDTSPQRCTCVDLRFKNLAVWRKTDWHHKKWTFFANNMKNGGDRSNLYPFG